IAYVLGMERTRTHDPTLDGKSKITAHLDEAGQLEREELDTNSSGTADLVRFYTHGKKTKETEDPDGDGVFNLVTLFEGDFPTEQQADSNGDGNLDTTITFKAGRKSRQE
ncbi:MAG: hypothetical protein ACKVK6_12775, partial [bacterium]